MKKLKQLILSALVAVTGAWCAQADSTKCTDCITFSADNAFGIKMTKGAYYDKNTGNQPPTVFLEYSTDQLDWKPFKVGTAYNAELDGGTYKLYIRGTNNTCFSTYAVGRPDNANYKMGNTFSNTVGSVATEIYCSGNIETLLDYKKVAKGEEPEFGIAAFPYLFYKFTGLTSAPTLPRKKLTPSCYRGMFRGTSLTTAPELPATELKVWCYGEMFQATKLKTPPVLPATTLESECYRQMFQECAELETAPELPARTVDQSVTNCYNGMFTSCTKLTKAPALPIMELTPRIYYNMFRGCTGLKTLPELPATNLTDKCYYCMFWGCTGIEINKNAPGREWKIPASATVVGWTGPIPGKTNVTPEQAADTTPNKVLSNTKYWAAAMFTNTVGDIRSDYVVGIGTTYYIKSAPGIHLGDNVYAYDQGNGTYSVNGSGELTKEGADKIKDKGITNLVIGAGVTKVGANAFDGWRSIRSVEIGADCATVGSQAFLECFNLSNVTSKATEAVSVGKHAFYRCNSLETMDFGVMPSFGEQSYTLQAGIYMTNGLPQVYSIPDITIGGMSKRHVYGTVELGDKADWVDVTNMSDEDRKAYHFFKIVVK